MAAEPARRVLGEQRGPGQLGERGPRLGQRDRGERGRRGGGDVRSRGAGRAAGTSARPGRSACRPTRRRPRAGRWFPRRSAARRGGPVRRRARRRGRRAAASAGPTALAQVTLSASGSPAECSTIAATAADSAAARSAPSRLTTSSAASCASSTSSGTGRAPSTTSPVSCDRLVTSTMQPGLPGSSGRTWSASCALSRSSSIRLPSSSVRSSALCASRADGTFMADTPSASKNHCSAVPGCIGALAGSNPRRFTYSWPSGKSGPTCRANRIARVVLPTPAVPVISAIEEACGTLPVAADAPGSSACSQSSSTRPPDEAGGLGRQLGRARRGLGGNRRRRGPQGRGFRPDGGRGRCRGRPGGYQRQPRDRLSRRRLGGHVERRVHREHPLVNPGQLGARVDAEVLGQLLPRVVEDAQRLGLPAAAVQGDHQQPARPLPQRVLGHQRGQLGHRRRGLPLGEHQVGPFLRRGGAQLGQPQPLRLRERSGHSGERLAAPQRERLVHDPRRTAQVARGTQLARPAKALLELAGVEAVGAEPQQVAAARGDEQPAPGPAATGPGPGAACPARERGAAPRRRCRCRCRRWPAAGHPTPRPPARRARRPGSPGSRAPRARRAAWAAPP